MRRHFLRAVGILPKTERSKKAGIGAGRVLSLSEKQRLCRKLLAEIARDKRLSQKILLAKKDEDAVKREPEGSGSVEDQIDDFEPDFDENLEKGFGEEGPSEPDCCPTPLQEALLGQEDSGYI